MIGNNVSGFFDKVEGANVIIYGSIKFITKGSDVGTSPQADFKNLCIWVSRKDKQGSKAGTLN